VTRNYWFTFVPESLRGLALNKTDRKWHSNQIRKLRASEPWQQERITELLDAVDG
jgi:hypothetical protein